ncbi:MAG: alpha/beta hydrolase-fold protein [Acidobacteriota bacterium]
MASRIGRSVGVLVWLVLVMLLLGACREAGDSPAGLEPAPLAAPLGDPWQETVELEVPSERLGASRTVALRITSVPGSERDTPRPLVMVMDGASYHGLVSGYAEAMARRWALPGLIIVSVPHQQREAELSSLRHGGIAENPFYRFLVDELTPFIAERYPAAPHRSLLGYSSGGAFALAALFENDGAFQGFVVGAAPPVERLDDGRQVELLPAQVAATRGAVPRLLHLGVGSLDQDWFLDAEEAIRQRLGDARSLGVELSARRVPGATHNSAAPQVLLDGLGEIFGPWELPISYQLGFDAKPLRTWSERHEARFGFAAQLPEEVLVQYGMGPFFDGDFATALPVFEVAAEIHPASPAAAWYLAASLRGLERPAEALEVAEAALADRPGEADAGPWEQRLRQLADELR